MIPTVSVITINWNHRHLLEGCLEALFNQTYPEVDIIVVDNSSSDGSVDWLARSHPEIQMLVLSQNQGFSRAFNLAVDSTASPLLLSLNPDVVVQPNFIHELVRAISEDDRIGIVAPKLLRADNSAILDSTGLFIDRRRRPYDRGQGCADKAQYDQQKEVFGACGAAALYRRTMLEDLAYKDEYLDEEFFAYYEDADLSWRAQARGWRALYAPQAVATHVRGWGDTLRKHQGRLVGRGARMALCNRYLMTAKNDTLGNFMRDMPQIFAAEIPRLAYLAIRKPSALLGIADFFQKLPSIRRKRRQLRQRNLVDNGNIRRWFLNTQFVAAD